MGEKGQSGEEPGAPVDLPGGGGYSMLADFGVVAIPRFILLDKKGRIVDGDFGMPAWARTEMDFARVGRNLKIL